MSARETQGAQGIFKEQLLLVVAGSCFVCRHFLTFWASPSDASLISSFGQGWSWMVAVAASIVSCAAFVLVSRRAGRTTASGWWYLSGFGLLLVALLVGAYAGWTGSDELSFAATVLLGLGNGVAFCIFIGAHLGEKPGIIIVLLASEFLVGSVLYLLVHALVPNVALVVPALALNVASGLLLWACARSSGKPASLEPVANLRPPVITFKQFCLVTVCFAASYGIVRTLATRTSSGSLDIEVLSTLVAALALLAFGLGRGIRSSQSFIMVIVGIFAVSFVSIPLYLFDVYVASLIHAVGFSLFLIVCWGFDAFYASENGASPLVVVGVTYACVQSGEVVGGLLMLVFVPLSELFLHLLSSALLFGLVALLMLFFMRQQRTKEVDYTAYFDLLAQACARLADEHGLTQREREILELTAQKKSNGQIMNELFISQNTLKTHLRHIHAKMGVHNRSELLDLVETEAARA